VIDYISRVVRSVFNDEKKQRIRFTASPDRHHQGIGDALRRHCRVH
jgi:hypothetical protein